ncbi:hypothetical protein ACQ86O_13225 [Serratia sp. L9]|uniref:hypothetical protein n=1 Tax=Serratia sp. L9 TaxID=3423946 RepID=UPI003D677B70
MRSIEDRYQPLTERLPKGYSLGLLGAIDRALALRPEDRPQTIDEMAELLSLSAASKSEIIGSRPATTSPKLVSIAQPQAVNETHIRKPWRPIMIGAGVAVVVIAGIITWLNSGPSSAPVPVVNNSVSAVATTPAPVAPAPASVAIVYFKLQPGEELKINGNKQNVTPDKNGFVALNMAPGNYKAEVITAKHQYQEKFTIETAGTWLINPQNRVQTS